MQAFFDHIRSRIFGGQLRQSQVEGINALLNATVGLPISHRAYILATAAFETAWTVQPIREYGQGKGRTYGKPGKHNGQIAYGRGFVQLTWDRNYEKADKELDLDGALVADYDLALDPEIAADILVRGCSEGWFTGKNLSDYLPGDYVNARRVVNGTDKAHQIAAHARDFEDALRLADVPQEAPAVVVAPTPAPEPVQPAPAPAEKSAAPKRDVLVDQPTNRTARKVKYSSGGGGLGALAGAVLGAWTFGLTPESFQAIDLSLELWTGGWAAVVSCVAALQLGRRVRESLDNMLPME